MISRLKEESFDLVIIGGGITGAGLALQATASGLKTALIEMQDFSQGTSSRSTKLVHGGIRYLKQFDVDVVAETVTERAVIQKIAPHIPKPDPMLMPIYEEDAATFSMLELRVAMNLYDDLAGIKDSPKANRLLDADQVQAMQANLSTENLVGGGFYLDYSNDDSRLVMENLKKAHQNGGLIISRIKAISFEYEEEQERISGVVVEDGQNKGKFVIQTKWVVNASGAWSDEVRSLDYQVEVSPHMRPTKGIHLVVDSSVLKVNSPIYFDSGLADNRMVFVIPRRNKTYFGTTDTDYFGDLANPQVTQADVDYLLKAVNRRFPQAKIEINDIESSWAGLRPLIASNSQSDYNGGKNTRLSNETFQTLVDLFADYRDGIASRRQVEAGLRKTPTLQTESESPSSISRGSELSMSPTGLLSIAGGKLTDYRRMAEGVMKEILSQGDDPAFELVDSANYPVSGGDFDVASYDEIMSELTQTILQKVAVSEDEAEELAKYYGTNVSVLLENVDQAKKYAEFYNYPLAVALSVVYALEHEMVLTPSDYFIRRTQWMLFGINEMEGFIEGVLKTFQDYFQFDKAKYNRYLLNLQKEMDVYSLSFLKNK